MEPNFNDIAAKLGIGGALMFTFYWGVAKAVPGILQNWRQDRLASANTNAGVATAEANTAAAKSLLEQIEALTSRMVEMEKKQESLLTQLENERRLRHTAENDVARLRIRVAALETQIKHLGETPT